MIKLHTPEEIYEYGLKAIRNFCRNRDFDFYCEQILKETEYFLKMGRNLSEASTRPDNADNQKSDG